MNLCQKLLAMLSVALGASTILCSSAMAGNSNPIAADLVVEWQNEYRNSDDKGVDGTNNSFLRAEFAPVVYLNGNFFIDAVLVFEPFDQVASKNVGDDIWFESNGLFAEEVKLNFEFGSYALWAGKFNPGFGTAWDFGRGIWGEDFAEDYEITEKIGVGAAYTFEVEGAGNHTVSATTFFADTSFLSGSTVTKRAKAKLSDGGASNTEDFGSFTMSLDGESLGGIKNLSYHLGVSLLGEEGAALGAGTDDETGFAAAINYVTPITDDMEADILLEYAGIQNFGGAASTDHQYYTASVVTTIMEDWNVTAGYTLRDIDAPGAGSDFDDHLFQLSGGYDFDNGLTAEGGWRSTDETGVNTHGDCI